MILLDKYQYKGYAINKVECADFIATKYVAVRENNVCFMSETKLRIESMIDDVLLDYNIDDYTMELSSKMFITICEKETEIVDDYLRFLKIAKCWKIIKYTVIVVDSYTDHFDKEFKRVAIKIKLKRTDNKQEI